MDRQYPRAGSLKPDIYFADEQLFLLMNRFYDVCVPATSDKIEDCSYYFLIRSDRASALSFHLCIAREGTAREQENRFKNQLPALTSYKKSICKH